MAKAEGNRGLIAVSIVVYLVCLIALTPLSVVHKFLAPENLPVEVVAVSGTLWKGEVVLKHPMTGQISSMWSIYPMALIKGQVKADLEVDSSLAQFTSQVAFNPLTNQVAFNETNGFVSANLVNKALVQSKTQVNGDFELSDTHLEYNLTTGESDEASGQVVWMGGNVVYPKGRKHAQAELPMLVAKITTENKELLANVSTVEGQQLATASIKKDGWANLAVRKAMIDLVGEKWPNKVSSDTVVFEVSERVFTR
ncbi:hypothetical protein NBRC116188_19370 [Oceaniserpentilla sp. 4NH20-0058]|uniref:type II secretion system protein N n=1 Tax=Oceaniserpentilla sp. 4NH20-0058 TaxID=3127660 RepID=UPI0031091E00